MSAAWFLIGIVLLAAAWNVATSLLIYDALKKRGRDPSFLLLRLYNPSYACEYRRRTVAETGRTGPLRLTFRRSWITVFFKRTALSTQETDEWESRSARSVSGRS